MIYNSIRERANKCNIKKYRDGDEGGFTCLSCGRSVYLDESISKRGDHLICVDCQFMIAYVTRSTPGKILKIVHKETEL